MDQRNESMNTDAPSEIAPNMERLSRRAFLRNGSLAAVGAAMIPAVGLMAPSELAYAQKFDTLGESVGKTLVRMARDIFPHDKVPDQIYASAIATYENAVATDASLKSLIDTGVSHLNALAISTYGKTYSAVPGEGERVVLLYAIEQSPFFQKVRGDLVMNLYNNKDVWPYFGYQGSSWEKGGYLNRGFNDIDWLPKV